MALNEPGTFLEESAHVVQLDAVTAKVGQKYFKENTSLTGGLTLGLAEFREAKRSILLVSGERKRDILGKLREKGEFQPALPATAIYAFEDVSVYCDKASWGEWIMVKPRCCKG